MLLYVIYFLFFSVSSVVSTNVMLLNCGAKIVQTERLSSLCEANIQKFYGLHPIFRDVTKRTDYHNSKLVSSTAILWSGLNFPQVVEKIL